MICASVRREARQRTILADQRQQRGHVRTVIAAFYLSLPDRSLRWALLPLPTLLLWLGSSGYSCWRQWIVHGPDGWGVGEGLDCFLWIVAFGVPLAIALFLPLRQALTGRDHGPDMAAFLPLIGKDRALARLSPH